MLIKHICTCSRPVCGVIIVEEEIQMDDNTFNTLSELDSDNVYLSKDILYDGIQLTTRLCIECMQNNVDLIPVIDGVEVPPDDDNDDESLDDRLPDEDDDGNDDNFPEPDDDGDE